MAEKWMLITFGAGLPNWRAAARRLADQARRSDWFSQIEVYDERRLNRDFPAFTREHAAVLNRRSRGFGYWIWKPFLIWKSLESARRMGITGVVYLDAGCELNYYTDAASQRFQDYQRLAHDACGVFAMHLDMHPEIAWTRTAVLDDLQLSEDQRMSPQIQATPFFTVSANALHMAEEWLGLCLESDYWRVKDGSTSEAHDVQFINHRHDQSVFSCLLKSRGTPTISDETFWAPNWQSGGAGFPIWAARNRTRVSILDNSIRGEGMRFFEKAYSRIFNKLILN